MRRKPITARRRFAALAAITVMGLVTAVWFLFFFGGLGDRLERASKNAPAPAVSEEAAARLNFQFPELPEFPSLNVESQGEIATSVPHVPDPASTTLESGESDGF